MEFEALWRALKAYSRDQLMHAQGDLATVELANDLFRAQGAFGAIQQLLAFIEEAEIALAEGRLSESGEIMDEKPRSNGQGS